MAQQFGMGPLFIHTLTGDRRGLLVNDRARIERDGHFQLSSPIHTSICYKPVRVELGLSRRVKGAGGFAYRMNVLLATSNNRMHLTCSN